VLPPSGWTIENIKGAAKSDYILFLIFKNFDHCAFNSKTLLTRLNLFPLYPSGLKY